MRLYDSFRMYFDNVGNVGVRPSLDNSWDRGKTGAKLPTVGHRGDFCLPIITAPVHLQNCVCGRSYAAMQGSDNAG